jgi:hypothetical protein
MHLDSNKFNFIALTAFFLALFSLPSVAQTIECQIMREQILSEARQQQSQQMPYQNHQQQGTMLNPSLAPLYAQAEQRGRLIGGGVAALGNALTGQPATLQDRINLYKQKCE